MAWCRSISCGVLGLLLCAGSAVDPQQFAVAGDESARISWMQRFASPNDDWVNDIVALKNGNVVGAGFLNRRDGDLPSDWLALAAEISPGGRVISRKTYGSGRGIDAFWSMVESPDGRRMFAGFTTRIGGGGIDGLALLTDAEGAPLSEQAFGGAGYDRFTSVTQVSDGVLFLGHSQAQGEDKRRIFVVKLGLDGQRMWERLHDAPESWGALYISPASDGGLIVAGGTETNGDRDMFAMKLDSQGQELWRKRVGTPDWDEVNHGLVVRPDGDILLVGYTHRRGDEANDVVAASLAASGAVKRLERFGGNGDDRAILAKSDSQGRVWIVGHTNSAGAGGTDLLLVRLDSRGRFEPAALTIGGSADDNGTALLPLGDGTLLLAGYSQGLGGGRQDGFVLHLAKPDWGRPNAAFQRQQVMP